MLQVSTSNLLVSTFYRVVDIVNYEDMKEPILECCNSNEIKGTILLSEEGINATVCGSESAINNMLSFLNTDERLADIAPQNTCSDFYPFQRMKVVLKKEIVKLDVCDVYAKDSGHYIDPEKWDDFISDCNVKLIDTRNFYETQIGSFKGAIIPDTENFRDFPEWFSKWASDNNIPKKQIIGMYCTGGIRCEKSTSYLKKMGFNGVFHLKGGILNYLISTKNINSKWLGDCFVFDDRVALTHRLHPSMSVRCKVCDGLVTTDDLKDTNRGSVVCIKCAPYSSVVNQNI